MIEDEMLAPSVHARNWSDLRDGQALLTYGLINVFISTEGGLPVEIDDTTDDFTRHIEVMVEVGNGHVILASIWERWDDRMESYHAELGRLFAQIQGCISPAKDNLTKFAALVGGLAGPLLSDIGRLADDLKKYQG